MIVISFPKYIVADWKMTKVHNFTCKWCDQLFGLALHVGARGRRG